MRTTKPNLSAAGLGAGSEPRVPRPQRSGIRALGLLLAIFLAALGITATRVVRDPPPPPTPPVRLPVENPPLEPDRPDLIGEPSIAESASPT